MISKRSLGMCSACLYADPISRFLFTESSILFRLQLARSERRASGQAE